MKQVIALLFFLTFVGASAVAAVYDDTSTGRPQASEPSPQAVLLQTGQASWTDIAQTYGPVIIVTAVILAFFMYGFHLIRTAMNGDLIFYYNFLDFATNIASIIILAIVLWKWPYRYIVYLDGTKTYDPTYLFLTIGIIALVVIYNLCMGMFMNYRYCHIFTGLFVGIYRTIFFVALPIALLFCIRTGAKKEFYGRPGEEHDLSKYRSAIDAAMTAVAMAAIFYTVSKLCNGKEVREKYGD